MLLLRLVIISWESISFMLLVDVAGDAEPGQLRAVLERQGYV